MAPEPPPDPMTVGEANDIAHSGIRMVLSAIPVLGGPASVLFESIFKKPSDRARDAVLEVAELAIDELKNRPDVDFDALRDDDEFCNFAFDVLRSASRAHRQEKLEALRNALVNGALPGADMMRSRAFLRFVDELEPHHLVLLELMADPASFLETRRIPFPERGDHLIEMDATTQHQSPRSLESIADSVLGDSLPEDLRDIALRDLERRGLVTTTSLSGLCTPERSFASLLGLEFRAFIAPSRG